MIKEGTTFFIWNYKNMKEESNQLKSSLFFHSLALEFCVNVNEKHVKWRVSEVSQ